MSNFNNIIEKFSVFWEIKNIQYITLITGQFIDSPVFCVPQFMNTKYYIRLYPFGVTEEFKYNTSCYLCRGDDSGPKNVEIEFNISISSSDDYYCSNNILMKDKRQGFSNLLKKRLNQYGNFVIITLEMYFHQLYSLRDLYNLESFIPFNFEGSLCFTEAVEKLISGETHVSTKTGLSFPVKCFAQTKVLCVTKSIERFIDSLISGTLDKKMIPVILPQKYPSLIVTLQSKTVEHIDFNIVLRDKSFTGKLILNCEIYLTNCVGQLIYSSEDEHTFTTGTDDWCIIEDLNISRFKMHLSDFSSDKINLTLNFELSLGETISEILSIAHIQVPRKFAADNKHAASNEIFRLYKENKLCDAALKIGNKTIDVHKVVLGATSPVFAAMFINEMTENKTSIVNIDDLDEKTIKEMVSFMYTGSVKELKYENAKNLFIAGDKYQILPLMSLSRDVMISHMNSDNIYEILSLADTHTDSNLEKEGVKFITSKSSILSSTEWANFEKKNTNFAVKILREVCLKSKNTTV